MNRKRFDGGFRAGSRERGPSRLGRTAGWARRSPRSPGERSRDQMRRVEVLVVGEAIRVGGEEAVELGGVIDAQVLVADTRPERQILAVQPGTDREQVAVPILDTGAEIGGDAAELELAVELASLEPPAQIERPGERVALGRIEVEGGPGLKRWRHQL